ncbi:porin family protein [Pseudozobellia thermophila]|nr:porin family protein [Pseudozobellia thermophila]
MKKCLLVFLWVLTAQGAMAQTNGDTVALDTRYLEDQFYIGLTYNFLLEKPDVVNQSNLSYGLQMGFIKDMPINAGRTVALGLGLGYGLYSYYSNLQAVELEEDFGYLIIDDEADFKRNKIESHMIEVPFEFRWRSSNEVSYKFWRVYTGFKVGYALGSRSKLVPTEGAKTSFYNTDIRKFQYGLTFNFGYNTFNLHAYYSLSNLFDDNVYLDGDPIDIKPLRLGIVFYIL